GVEPAPEAAAPPQAASATAPAARSAATRHGVRLGFCVRSGLARVFSTSSPPCLEIEICFHKEIRAGDTRRRSPRIRGGLWASRGRSDRGRRDRGRSARWRRGGAGGGVFDPV